MAQRTRTAKSLAQRIDLSYFKRRHPLRRWRAIVSIAAPAAALLWIAGMAAAGSKATFNSGPLAPAHQVFTDRCERCHVRVAGHFSAAVADTACVACHAAPAHRVNQTSTPPCASCHADHRGAITLAATDDAACTSCHRDLKTSDGKATVLASVGAFASGHPEFAAKRGDSKDTAVLRFNHAAHMKENLRGPDGGSVTLACATCHVPIDPSGRGGGDRSGGLMRPIEYKRDCASCHALYFDPLIDAQVPHDKTDVVHAFVDARLRQFIAANPQQMGKAEPVRGRIPVNFPDPFPPTVAKNSTEWVSARTTAVESYLWKKTCAECHALTAGANGASGAPPQTVPTAMRASWMPHARFDHRAHQLATCVSCHAGAATSTETSDVLVPAIATCRQCHDGMRRSADARCSACHDYHDWLRPAQAPAGFPIEAIR